MSEHEAPTFERTLEVLEHLRDEQKLFVRLVPPFYAELDFTKEDVEHFDSSLDYEEFHLQAHVIEILLTGVLFDRLEGSIDQELKRLKVKPEAMGAERAKFSAWADLVSERLIDPRLKARTSVKQTSKAAAFASLDWDIKLKIADAGLETIRFPYSTLRLNFQREFGGEPFAVVGGRLFESVQVNFTADEINHVIGILSKVLERLRIEEEAVLGQ